MGSELRSITLSCLKLLLRPVVKFCMRHSLTIQDLHEMSKQAYIDLAAEELQSKEQKVNVSRLSVLTGLRRREVTRLFKGEESAAPEGGLVTRVIGQWLQDSRFVTSSGKARVLSLEGEESEFRELVRSVSTDVKPGTVLSELNRLQAVEESPRGLKLVMNAYVPKNDPVEGFKLLALDAEDLALAVEENIFLEPKVPNHHATTEYDNISKKHLGDLRKWLFEEGINFHKKARAFISKLDKDVKPELGGKGGVRVVLGSFSRISEPQKIRRKKKK